MLGNAGGGSHGLCRGGAGVPPLAMKANAAPRVEAAAPIVRLLDAPDEPGASDRAAAPTGEPRPVEALPWALIGVSLALVAARVLRLRGRATMSSRSFDRCRRIPSAERDRPIGALKQT